MHKVVTQPQRFQDGGRGGGLIPAGNGDQDPAFSQRVQQRPRAALERNVHPSAVGHSLFVVAGNRSAQLGSVVVVPQRAVQVENDQPNGHSAAGRVRRTRRRGSPRVRGGALACGRGGRRFLPRAADWFRPAPRGSSRWIPPGPSRQSQRLPPPPRWPSPAAPPTPAPPPPIL